MSYRNELIEHLVAYKRTHLGSIVAGTYNYRGQNVLRQHILPHRDGLLNLMESTREEIVVYLSSNPQIKKHKYFHHLNSSQAFALNLFVPYFQSRDGAAESLLTALGQKGSLVGWELESVPDTVEGTNLDAVWDTSEGVRTFCEVKLSEQDFGKARRDQRHLDKLREIYLPRLAPYLDQEMQAPTAFFASYQILRNVWHMLGTANARLLLLLPRANANLWPLLGGILARLPPSVHERISTVAIEDVLKHLQTDPRCPRELRAYAEQLQTKYVPQNLAT